MTDPQSARPDDEPHLRIDLPALAAFLRRRAWIIAAAILFTTTLGALYAFTAQPKFAAVAGLVIDNTQSDLSRVGSAMAPAAEDLVAIETQMQIIRSQEVALSVVDALELVDNPFFIPDRPDVITGAIGRLRLLARGATSGSGGGAGEALEGEPVAITPRERAAVAIRNNLNVYRVGSSRAIDVMYTGNHPQLSAAIANAVTRAYVDNRLLARFDAAENAGDWLRVRIAELQEQFIETARQVQEFRAENDIVETGGGRGLVNQQALAEVNRSLVEASTAAAEARARFADVQDALAAEDLPLETLDSGQSALIATLRSRLVERAAQESELATRLSPDSPALQNVRLDLQRIENTIRAELRRVAERLRTEQDVATARENELRNELVRLIQSTNATEEAQVRLLQLESEAEVLQTAYESYLQRYTDVIQQQSAPFLQARTISPALVPTGPTSPRKALVLVVSFILGAGMGLALAVLVEMFDRSIRLPRHLEEIGVPSLGVVPLVKPAGKAFRGASRGGAATTADAMARGDEFAYVAHAPQSPFANGLRRAKSRIVSDLPAGRGAVLGIVSLSSGEGASTIASNLGRLFALGGATTLLVDANLHNSAITGSGIVGDPVRRLNSIGADTLRDRLRDPADNDPTELADGADLLASPRMRAFLEEMRSKHEVTILDLPALEDVPDANAVAPYLDSLILVSQWGHTSRPALAEAVEGLRRQGVVLSGGIINKARLRAMRLHGHRPTDLGYASRTVAPQRRAA